MPNLTTHIHFALLLFEREHYDIHLPSFIEGAVFPGLRPNRNTVADAHSLGIDHDILTSIECKNRKEFGIDSFSYRLGYLSHSFLDHYFDAYRAEIFLFKSPIKEERMRAVSMAEQIDIMHMRKYETDLKNLSEKYGEEFTSLYHAAPVDNFMEIERDYEDLMTSIVEKFTQFLKALNFTSVSDDLIP